MQVYRLPAALEDENKTPWIIEAESGYSGFSGKVYRDGGEDRRVHNFNITNRESCFVDNGRIVMRGNSRMILYVRDYHESLRYLDWIDGHVDFYPQALEKYGYVAEPLIPEIVETMGMHEPVTEADLEAIQKIKPFDPDWKKT